MSGTYKVGSGRKFSSFFKSPTKYEGETLILKVLAEKNDAAIGEAKALKIAKRLVDSGMLKDPKLATSEPKPVIIMKEVSGLPLYKNPGYRASKPHLRDELKKQTFKMMCEKIATIALGTGVLLTDTKPSNVLVNVNAAGNSITSVDMVDFGPPSTYFLKNPKPTKKELLEFCGSEPLSGKYHSWIGQFDELAPHIPPPQKKKTY
ncbi:hypothetical protein BDP27DRAFT_825411 [Rhodocollybia butyracea]|uniref:Protein kinase domain-containing protein n=1 Tax=Rhodocollybia butyracea TaxID=206335 RepID=A0A9P5PQZ4_9AGAR|nr:hypothetical protein BDP27DRAFT_825411 [Rhodocollybia butyracea]